MCDPYEAAEKGDEAELRRLIRWGWDVNSHRGDYNGRDTALMAAARAGNEGCVRLLLESKASVNDTTSSGNTALHGAACNGRLAIATRLLLGGADLTLRNDLGRTALDDARKMGKSEMGKSEVVALLSRGAPHWKAAAAKAAAERAAAAKAAAEKTAADKAAADKAAAEELRRRATALGLLEALTDVNVADDAMLKKAIEWCDDQGVMSVSDLVEYDMVDEFVFQLRLKTLPSRKLRKALLDLFM